jgi:phage-related tail fiber protein
MSQTYYTLLTQIGAAELTNSLATNVSLPVTHLAVGDGNGNPVVPGEGMAALTREVHRVAISSVAADLENPNWLIFEAVLPAAIGGWTIREIGLIGGTGGGNKLLAIGNFPATYKPVLAEGAAKDLVIRMFVEVSNASVVTLNINPAVVVATVQAINNAVAAHEAKTDPHGQYIKTNQRGAANGVAPLGADNLVPLAHLPPAIATDAELAASLAAHVDPLTDPHPQYITADELAAALAGRRGRSYFIGQL